ncbi:hypothetical protein PSQ90_11415 [Devosia rhodophyticola]|uniref:Uncharacterized protein n=1 Tax=Devosia rhodophyticola TaxID=3026423 RepID=A0ABY7YU86_9HYPH|nr:hypothetical protein [Devosia rhodophyticola]WDR04910.1 hypothetical protein PSQ90_11415 [Devosia rhodophyticola]
MRPHLYIVVAALLAFVTTAMAQSNEAESISSAVFGPRIRVDDAYGAYQRGFYLTALSLALPRAEKKIPPHKP